jgi:hypothetical protein
LRMQQVRERRSIDTPADVPQACSPVALRRSNAGGGTMHHPALNSPEREGDRLENLVTLWERCHDLVTKGEILLRPGRRTWGTSL